MLICVSLNPALDTRLKIPQLTIGRVNRATESIPAPGGKAAHAAMVLRTLGADPVWLGFAGGTAGVALVNGLRGLSIRVEVVPIANATRSNLEIIDTSGVTEILEPGPRIAATELASLEASYEKILSQSEKAAIVVLSGSLPPGVPMDFYRTLVDIAHVHGSRVFVDTSGEAFSKSLAGHPDFVKPNRDEAEIWKHVAIDGLRSAADVLKDLLAAGASAGAISLGADGLVCRMAGDGDNILVARGPRIQSQSSVGSGDSTLAGFAFAARQGLPPADSLRLAAACGAANCLAEGPGRASLADIMRLQQEIHVENLQSPDERMKNASPC